jgi:hypothetical protein
MRVSTLTAAQGRGERQLKGLARILSSPSTSSGRLGRSCRELEHAGGQLTESAAKSPGPHAGRIAPARSGGALTRAQRKRFITSISSLCGPRPCPPAYNGFKERYKSAAPGPKESTLNIAIAHDFEEHGQIGRLIILDDVTDRALERRWCKPTSYRASAAGAGVTHEVAATGVFHIRTDAGPAGGDDRNQKLRKRSPSRLSRH